jgi:hypothetical protein
MIDVCAASLTGRALDYCIGKVEGHSVYVETVAQQMARVSREDFTEYEIGRLWEIYKPKVRLSEFVPCPEFSSDWSQGGPLISKYLSGCQLVVDDELLISAMRVIVSKVLGETVSVPSDLFNS